MELFTYLMAKNDHNTSVKKDLFSYLLGKNQSGTYTDYSGTSLSINNTKKGKMKVNLLGNTSQETTTGKNLLRYNLQHLKNKNTTGTWDNNVYTHNGLTITINDDLSIRVNGTSTATETFFINNEALYLPTGTYYLSGATNGSDTTYDIRTYNYDGSNVGLQCFTGAKEVSFVNNNNQAFNVAIVVRNAQTLNNVMFYPMLATTNDTTYEPYTNGASPNTDYPQVIHTITGDNSIIVEGKNLFDKTTITEDAWLIDNGTVSTNHLGYSVSDYILIQPNTAYYKTNNSSPRNKYYDINKQPLDTTTYQDISIGGNAGTFTTPNNAYYLRITINTTRSNIDTMMINKGNTALPYEPYQSNSVLLTLGDKEICWIGNYKDKIFKAIKGDEIYDSLSVEEKNTLDYGKWYLRKAINKVVLDGSETGWNEYSNANNLKYFGLPISTGTPNSNRNMLSDHFTKVNSLWELSSYINGTQISSNLQNLLFMTIDYTSLANFKTWLSNNNTTVYYVLATPTYTPITGTLKDELEALQKAQSYKGTTNINQINNDLPFNMNVSVKVGS